MPLANLKSTPIVILCFNRLAPLQQLLGWLDRAGYVRPILIDNASTYPPLVDFLDQATDIETVRLERNVGHLAPWISAEARAKVPLDAPIVVTDCDVVPDDDCPADVVTHLAEVLLGHSDIDKVGLGLHIDDLPDSYALKNEVVAWESRFWEKEIYPGVFDAEVDTTFALYRSLGIPHSPARALRTGAPYLARHLPWYANSAEPTEEQSYYREHADSSASHWEGGVASDDLRALLNMRADEVATAEIVGKSDNPLLKAWLDEPALEDEASHTPWADPGWLAWNGMSPELEFCDFAAALMLLLQPALVIETGVGQGYLTRRLAARMRAGQRLLVFEDDAEIRRDLEGLPFFSTPNRSLGASSSPAAVDLAGAGLTILDSEVPIRLEELDLWIEVAPPGAMLLVHDTGNGHGPETAHQLIRDRLNERGVDGVFLRNPRGSFLGLKPNRTSPPHPR